MTFSDPRTAEGLNAFNRGETELAMSLWRSAAAAGDAEAIRHLAVEARDAGSRDEAIRLYTQACELGSTRSYEQLGGIYYLEGDISEARRVWRIGASLGDSQSMTLLALTAEEANEVSDDDLDFLVQASRLGNALASEQLALKVMLDGSVSKIELTELWRTAAEQGSFVGCAMLAVEATNESRSADQIYWADRALACSPPLTDDSDVQVARVLGMKAAGLMMENRFDEALAAMEQSRATAITPENDQDQLIQNLRILVQGGSARPAPTPASPRTPMSGTNFAQSFISGESSAPKVANFCTSCGHPLEQQHNFCPECGARI